MQQPRQLRDRVSHALLAAAVVAGIAAACARKGTITDPGVEVGEIRITGNRVEWTTDRPARVSVRYGSSISNLDHMAYPDAAGRRDRAFATAHSVALLDLLPGRSVYYQAVSEVLGAQAAYSSLDSFVATSGPTPRLLVSTMIHIGFGDSHLVTMPTTGRRLLIDAGERDAQNSVITYLNDHGVTRIDVMLATHTHIDHMGGVVGSSGSTSDGTLGAFPPANFLDSPLKTPDSAGSAAYRELQSTLAGLNLTADLLRRGESSATNPALRWDPEVVVLVLNSGTPPDYQPTGDSGDDTNNESIVLRFSYGDVDFVIGGDAEAPAEASMLRAFPAAALEVEFAKVHHHGLPDASSAGWINTLKPRVGFIPNTQLVWDGNLAGALAASTGRLEGIGAHVYVVDEARALGKPRSSRQYNVSFVTDGVSYEVRLEAATQSVPPKPDATSECGPHL